MLQDVERQELLSGKNNNGKNVASEHKPNPFSPDYLPEEVIKAVGWIPSLDTCDSAWLQVTAPESVDGLNKLESEQLKDGAYIRIAILTREAVPDMAQFRREIESIENVKHTLERNSRLLYILLFVEDCLVGQDTADMSKYDKWHKHDKTAQQAVLSFQERLNEILPGVGVSSYEALYATTNYGTLLTRAAGNLGYAQGNDDIDQRFFACPHDSYEDERDSWLNGVQGYRRIYPIVTAAE